MSQQSDKFNKTYGIIIVEQDHSVTRWLRNKFFAAQGISNIIQSPEKKKIHLSKSSRQIVTENSLVRKPTSANYTIMMEADAVFVEFGRTLHFNYSFSERNDTQVRWF